MNEILEQLNNFQLTTCFNLQEFEDHEARIVRVDCRLVMRLTCLRLSINRPIIITSGFRTKATNDKVGGHSNSGHLHGIAADGMIRDIDPDKVIATAKIVGIDKIRYNEEKDFYHFEINP